MNNQQDLKHLMPWIVVVVVAIAVVGLIMTMKSVDNQSDSLPPAPPAMESAPAGDPSNGSSPNADTNSTGVVMLQYDLLC